MASPLGLIAPSLAARRTRPAGEVTTPLVTRAVVVTGVPDGWEPSTRDGTTVNSVSVVGRTSGRRNLQVSITARQAPGIPAWIPFSGPSGATYSQPAGESQAAVVWAGPVTTTPVIPPLIEDPQPAPIYGTIDLYGLLPTDGVLLDGVTTVPTMDGSIARLTRVSPGTHTLVVNRPNAAPFTTQVTVDPAVTAVVMLDFGPSVQTQQASTLGWLAVIAAIGGAAWWASKRA